MIPLFRKHINSSLAILAFVFLVMLAACFAWAVGFLVANINQANITKITSQGSQDFDISDAERLNYRGLATSTGAGIPATL